MEPFDLFDLPRRMMQLAEQEAAEAIIRASTPQFSSEDADTLRSMGIKAD